jgi:UDP-3-O-[3-hydroxymyristoyl] N-acetylglucosamine deacetylase
VTHNLSQKTINSKIDCSGLGLHSNNKVNLTLLPAPENSGIIFRRVDVKDKNNEIIANYLNVSATNLGTVIKNSSGVEVATVEHLMAAIWGCGIDNLIIEIDSIEVPIMDGSSEPFVFLIECAGISEQSINRKEIEILKTIRFDEEDKFIEVSPNKEFSMNIKTDFRGVGIQDFTYKAISSSFKTDICRARTFCFKSEIDKMYKMGLAKGGSLKNAIVLEDDGSVINQEGLRYKDELVKHKVLDFIGDIYLSGYFIIGHFKAFKPGHAINNKLLRKLFSDKDAWRLV